MSVDINLIFDKSGSPKFRCFRGYSIRYKFFVKLLQLPTTQLYRKTLRVPRSLLPPLPLFPRYHDGQCGPRPDALLDTTNP